MNEAGIAQTVLTVFLGLVFLGFFIWAWKSGQFKNVEEAKYHVFQENAKKQLPNKRVIKRTYDSDNKEEVE
jgi:cbb3-type cytochrome oxidase maturation protein